MAASAPGPSPTHTGLCGLEFVSVGCNSGANGMDWGHNGLVAYGGCNFVALYNTETYEVTATLCGHTGRVNGVKWIPNVKYGKENRWEQAEEEIISASTDKTLIVWKKEQDKWVQTAKLTGHTESVTAVAVVDLSDGSIYAASTSVDATLRIWHRAAQPNSPWVCVQTITRAPKMYEAVSLAIVPSTIATPTSEQVIVAAGGVDGGIHLFSQNFDHTDKEPQFKQLVVLEGHQDWVRCLTFATADSHTLLLASSSQDNRVRLWSIAPLEGSQIGNLLGENAASRMSSKGHVVDLFSGDSKQKFVVLLDAVLAVHDDWVYSVAWHPRMRDVASKQVHQPLKLLTASMDRTMIVWEPAGPTAEDDTSVSGGIWLDTSRVGEMGGNTLGFYGCAFAPRGEAILAHGYNGAFHLWKKAEEKLEGSEGAAYTTWEPVVTVSGHFAGVEDLMWDTTGSYFTTVSEDKTARIFSQWALRDKVRTRETWHEIARPQIHGYELTTLTFVQGKRHRIVTGAEEKLLRVFDAPQTFVDSLTAISGIDLGSEVGVERPLAASQPALGLSNKPFYEGGSIATDTDMPMSMGGEDEGGPLELEQQKAFAPSVHTDPPFEEDLLQATLWPEVMKLYGHGNEIVTVCCSNDGSIVASACKGTTPETSAIRLWNTQTWESLGTINAHTLTVTQMAFSHDDKYLLTVSRDRQFCILEKQATGVPYKIVTTKAKAHARILWGCDWSHDDALFATASRDETVKVWGGKAAAKLVATIQTPSPATAVAFLPNAYGNNYVLAVGEENGRISLWTGGSGEGKWSLFVEVPAHLGHVSVVRRLRWRHEKEKMKDKYLLATCSSDWSARVFSFALPIP